MNETEGSVPVGKYSIYYRLFSEPGKRVPEKGTVVCLHGGPGATHDYLLPMSDLVSCGYDVLLYDQLGCGRSSLPRNVALFTIENNVEELEVLRRKLRLGRIHLMGSSYGGLLALAYALRYQRNLRSIITEGGLASVPLASREMQRLKMQLPDAVIRTMEKYEEAGDYSNAEYLKAVEVFYRRHVCRLSVWPPELVYSMEHISSSVYNTMNGPNEFTIIGNIRYWDISDRLGEICVPTLVTGGKYDEVTPVVARQIHRGVEDSKLLIFNESSHLPMWEERERFFEKVSDFLNSL
ncbi:MAG: proline iminopeptidase-family hydrolase [Thermoplasmata archaeon]|uniref:Proline iminopeptidase n=1 Tax=Candidatus Sysuiplasma superficiale TaxID=2823368 RepID=A0A8J7YJK9_9ARCH|nr:proline iminopeptidase-family hydrolase [Candidatus Sysuiplasma superficiale]MBX8643646.1 proline iminopeptidase-family hydrolase [Candidatus Sysuiplasma superficiale]